MSKEEVKGSALSEGSHTGSVVEKLYLPELLTTDMVAEIFGVSKATIYEWRMRRAMPYLKLGQKTYFLESSLQSWLKSRETTDSGARKATRSKE